MRYANLCILLLLIATFSIPISSLTLRGAPHFKDRKQTPSSKQFWLNALLNPNKVGDFGPNFQCFVCTLLLTTVEQYATLHQINIDDFVMKDFCNFFPKGVRATCQGLVNQYGAQIVASLLKHSSGDQACRDIKICSNPKCNLMPQNKTNTLKSSGNWENYKGNPALLYHEASSPFDLRAGKTNHTPQYDFDGDFFSQTVGELRGYHWRGRDCDDLNAKIYPGRKTNPFPGGSSDFNCNGIKGANPKTGKAYKDELCENSGQMGVVVMGDSAGAHCEIPPSWVNASEWNSTTFANIGPAVEDEIDLPHMSAYTGYMDVGNTGPVSSVYKKLLERNKCNFRDYQNIAVNGASSIDSLGNIMALSRSQQDDQPVLAFLELIANDICDHRPTFDAMTTPEQFKTNMLAILDYLDTRLPPGSHLTVIGLVNGSMVFEGVKDKMHPIGVSYSQYYDFSNCIEASFCWGWLNTNATVREITTQKAMELNQVHKDILSTYQAKNFDFIYLDFPAQEIWDEWVAKGNDPYELIEPVDGFHPNQIFTALLADKIWEHLEAEKPEWLGPVNPNNDLITQLFGDQGGY